MQLQRSKWKAFSEGLIEWTIRVSGISAVVFVFAIFIFVFWEGKGLLFSDDFSISELLTSEKWDPTHTPPSYGAARIILGTFSVAIVAMIRKVLRTYIRASPLASPTPAPCPTPSPS